MRMNHPFAASALAIAAAVVLGLAAPARAAQFTGGPSVRVNPNVSIEFHWITDVEWFGKLEVFDHPDGTGTQLLTRRDEDAAGQPIAATHHTVTVNVFAPLVADTGYFLKVTDIDPTGNLPDLVTPTPLPPFFTGAQAIGSVLVDPGLDSALISWDANVIGFGQVDYGLTTPGDIGTLADTLNITDHAIELTGLAPNTTYQFRVSNLHAIDGDALVEQTGSFTTVPEPSALMLGILGLLSLAILRWRLPASTSVR